MIEPFSARGVPSTIAGSVKLGARRARPRIVKLRRLPKFACTKTPSVKRWPCHVDHARGRARAGLEAEGDHAGAAADAAFLDRPACAPSSAAATCSTVT